MSVLNLICSDGFITVNRHIASIVGLEAAAVLGELASEYLYWQSHDPEFDGEFYSTIENLERRTYLSAHSQRIALNKLQENGWITVSKKGMPAKRYIRIHEEKINEVVNDKSLKFLTTGDKNFERQDVKIFNTNNNINNDKRERENNEDRDIASVVNDCNGSDKKKEHVFLSRPVERRDIEIMIDKLMNAYPYAKKKIDRNSILETWEQVFRDVNADVLFKAINICIGKCRFFPTVSEINEEIKRAVILLSNNNKKNEKTSVQEYSEDIEDFIKDVLDNSK